MYIVIILIVCFTILWYILWKHVWWDLKMEEINNLNSQLKWVVETYNNDVSTLERENDELQKNNRQLKKELNSVKSDLIEMKQVVKDMANKCKGECRREEHHDNLDKSKRGRKPKHI